VSFSAGAAQSHLGTPAYGGGNIYLRSSDRLMFPGLTSGILRLSFIYEGDFSYAGGDENSGFFSSYGLVGDGWTAGVQYNGAISDNHIQGRGAVHRLFNPTGSPVGTADLHTPSLTLNAKTNLYSGMLGGTLYIPFSAGFVDLTQEFTATWLCESELGNSCSVRGDFLHTAAVGDAALLDTAGNPLTGFTITSESGLDYSRELATPTSVPEPASWLLIAAGLAALKLKTHSC
jgi:hypothetical protein